MFERRLNVADRASPVRGIGQINNLRRKDCLSLRGQNRSYPVKINKTIEIVEKGRQTED
jgi:hypothetical protein